MNYAAPLTLRHLRERHLQIAKADAPQAAMKVIDKLAKEDSACAPQWTRHETEQFHDYPDCQIFDSVAHFGHADGNIY